MQRNRSSLTEIGLMLMLAGVAVYIALWLGRMLAPFAGIAVAVGIVLYLIGLMKPGKLR